MAVSVLRSLNLFNKSVAQAVRCTCLKRFTANYVSKYLRELYNRRLEQGPEPERPRSVWSNWNYDCELFAFGARLGEQFSKDKLKQAFRHRSESTGENVNSSLVSDEFQPLVVDDDENKTFEDKDILPVLETNERYIQDGERISSEFISAYLQSQLPKLPLGFIQNIRDYLLSTPVLNHVALNLGIKDLIASDEFPPSEKTLASTLMAVIGALADSTAKRNAEHFVLDFIITQLIGKDLINLCPVPNPKETLSSILSALGREPPEPRLLFQSGQATVLAVYVVGIYSNKQLIGKSPGETVSIAEEQAYRESVYKILGLNDGRAAFKFGRQGREVDSGPLSSSDFGTPDSNQGIQT